METLNSCGLYDDENSVFELPNFFVDKGKDAARLDSDRGKYEEAVAELVQGQAKDLKISIQNVISMYDEYFFPYLPYNMVMLKSYIVDNFKKSYVSVVDLSKVFSIVKMVHVVGTNAQLVSDFSLPHRQTTIQMTQEIADNLSLMSENGMQLVQGGTGEYSIDYIVPKNDGRLVFTFKVIANNVIKHHLFTGSDIKMVDPSVHVFVAEMCGRDLIMFHGYDQFDYPGLIMINREDYAVKFNMPIAVEQFLALSAAPSTDGYIFGINGMEYKVKYENTIDIEYHGGTCVRMLGDNYIVCNRPRSTDCRIHEMVMRGEQLYYVRPRPDKYVGQSSVEVLALNVAPTVNYVRSLLSNIKGPCYGSYRDIKPNNIIASNVCDYLIRDNKSSMSVINTAVVKSIASRLGIVTTAQDVKHVLRCLNCRVDRLEKKTRSQLLLLTFPKERFASRSDIYKFLLETKLVLTPVEVARQLAMRGFTTSLKRIVLMMLYGELHVVGSRVMARRICGKFVPYRDKRPTRVLCQYDDLTFIRALSLYAKLNAGAHVLDNEITNLKQECDELFEHFLKTDVSLHEEIGDVVIMITKVALRIYAPSGVIEDEHAYIWQLLAGLNVLQPFKEKCLNRIAKYKCVRNHLTCGSHVCCDGTIFESANPDALIAPLDNVVVDKITVSVGQVAFAERLTYELEVLADKCDGMGPDIPPFGQYVPKGSLGPYDLVDTRNYDSDPDQDPDELDDMEL